MIKIFITAVIMLLTVEILADVDSLKNSMNRSAGKHRIELLIQLIERLEREDPAAALSYGREALDLLIQNPDSKLKTNVYYRMGRVYAHKNNLDSANLCSSAIILSNENYPEGEVMNLLLLARIARVEEDFDKALSLLDQSSIRNEKLQSKKFQVNILNEKGAIFRRLGKFNEALQQHNSALKLFEDFEDDEELRSTYTFLGIINDVLGNYDQALKYHQHSLEISRKLKDNRASAGTYHNMGVLYQKIQKYPESLEYYNRALEYWQRTNNQDGTATTLNSIGAVHELRGNNHEALKYYQQALDIWEKTGSTYSVGIALHNIGTSYYYIGDYPKALEYLLRTYGMRDKVQDRSGLGATLVILGAVYNKLGNFKEAVITAKEGTAIAEENGSLSSIRHAHEILAEIYESNGYYREALDEYKKFQAANDSMFNSQSQEAIAEMQEKYKSEEQKREISLLQKDKEIQNLYTTILIAGIILLILVLVLMYVRYRLKQSKAAIIQTKFDQKNKELIAARELQLSMIPEEIPSCKTLCIEADMSTATEVGGDYYDFYKTEDNTVTIAVGDATGHGVMAGIMVTAVKSLFNLLAPDTGLLDILCRSTKTIRKMGMKNLFMAHGLLRIKDYVLETAGAGMPPVYIFHSATGEVESIPLKGLPLGIAKGDEYTNTFTEVAPGDIIVVMSDGFPEMFNRQKENLGYEKIPLMLKESGRKSPKQIIKDFKDAAADWAGGISQQDDMTFVVIKVS